MRKIVKLVFSLVVYISLCNSSLFAASTEWAKSFGGNGNDQPYATAIDANGNLFVLTKYLETCDFDPNPNEAVNVTPTSLMTSVAVSKYSANGTFLWVKSFSVNVNDGGTVYPGTMVLDKSGNVYFAGNFSGTTDFNPDPIAVANLSPEAITPAVYEASVDAFICKLDNNGNFVWVKQFRGDLNQEILGLSVDDASNVFISSISSGLNGIETDFNPDTTTSYLLKNTSSASLFISKLDVDGKFVWAKQIQGTDERYSYAVKTDKSGNIYVGGYFMGTIYPDPASKTTSMTSTSLADLFFIKWDAAGNYIWSKSFGGSGYDILQSMAVDQSSGNVYIVGQFIDTVNFNGTSTPTKILVSDRVSEDGFIVKYDGNGNCLWTKSVAGAGAGNASCISLDGIGNLFVGGMFDETANFDRGASNESKTTVGNYDGYVMKLDTLGSFKWVKQIGGLGNDWTDGVSATGDGNVFAAGVFKFGVTIINNTDTLFAVKGFDAWMYKSSATTDIKELKLDAKVSIYPNPTFGKAVLNLNKVTSEVTVTIRSAIGGLISSQSYKDATKVELSFPKASGLYLVELKDAKGRVQTLKVLKK